jgi:hypothetical protein
MKAGKLDVYVWVDFSVRQVSSSSGARDRLYIL